ncbi:MAG: hypothetical protein NVS3B20_27060 [Polyangiales bacterium]
MSPGAAAQNIIFMGLPVAVYALFVRWRAHFSFSEIAARIGLARGDVRAFVIAIAACVPAALLGVWLSSWTKGFQGSMVTPFDNAPPTARVLASALTYGLFGTGFPEELLFRGLIAGVLFRRLSFFRANLLQAAIFVLPHLLILLVAPTLWLLAIFFPLALGLFAGWLRFSSRSIAPGVLVHSVSNMAGALAVMNWHR